MTARILEAFVIASPDDAGRTVAGVPLLVRTVLSLERAGVERCTIVGPVAPPADPRIRCVVRAAATLEPPADPALRLVVGAGAVVDPDLVRGLQGLAQPGEALVVEAGDARVRVAPGPRVAADDGLHVAPFAGTLLSTAIPAAAIEAALLRALDNPREGYLDGVLYRPFSQRLTRLLLRTPLSANAVTALGTVIGMLGGVLVGAADAAVQIAAVCCLVASSILDCCDGELARIRFAESRIGHWMDVVGDTLVAAALLAGIAWHLDQNDALPGAPALAFLTLGVLGAFGVITWSEQTEARRHRVHAWENTVLERVLSPLTTHDWYVFPVTFALAGQLAWLVSAAAVGANLFWIVTLVLVRRVLTAAPVPGPTGPRDRRGRWRRTRPRARA